MGVWIEIPAAILFFTTLTMSLPAWECGLKYDLCKIDAYRKVSLPAWECGLKYYGRVRKVDGNLVTPCVGVWIEMALAGLSGNTGLVTPCVGVWIEIVIRLKAGKRN